jgi:hypothetical protein
MSLGKYKNKQDKYSDVFNINWELNADCWYYYDDYYNYDYYDDDYYYDYYDWEYKEKVYKKYISKRLGRIQINESFYGSYIDMDKIYEMGTNYYRERMLARILGDEKWEEDKKTKLGDFIKK